MTISDTARNLLALAEKVQMASVAYEKLHGANDARCLTASNHALERACSPDAIAALCKGYLEAERALRWIPVGERLPTHNYSVAALVVDAPDHTCDEDDPMLSTCSYVDPNWLMADGDGDTTVKVSHWMPLPNPPERAAIATRGKG